MKPSREKMFNDLKSIKKPLLADIDFGDYGDMGCKVLTSTTGYIGGWVGVQVCGPFMMTVEQYEEAKRLVSLGYKKSTYFNNDESITDDERDRIEGLFDDLDLGFLLIKHKCRPDKEYYCWAFTDPTEIFFGEGKKAIEELLIEKAPTSPVGESAVCWEDMADDTLAEWHSLLSDPKLTQWEEWTDSEIEAWVYLDIPEDPMVEHIERTVEEMQSAQGLTDEEAKDLERRFKGLFVKSPGYVTEELDVVLDKKKSDRVLYDAIPLEKLMVDCPNLSGKSSVWVLSKQHMDKEHGSTYEVITVTDTQEGALNVCQGEISDEIEQSLISRGDGLKLHIKKEHIPLGKDVNLNIRIELHIKEYGVTYLVSSQMFFSGD